MKGLGTDIIEVERIRSSFNEYPDKFLAKILTLKEIAYCSSFKEPFLHYHIAGRFAAKEAVAKALGTGFGEELSFHDIEIFNNAQGKPEVKLSEKADNHFDSPTFLLSISHCKSHAIATAIAL